MKEQVIIQSITISKRNQQHCFQIKLPRDTQRIIGVETGLSVLYAPPYSFTPLVVNSLLTQQNNMMGVLQLQTNGRPDIFYSKEIFERDLNITAGEIKIFPQQEVQELNIAALKVDTPPDGNSFDFFTGWTHGTKREEDPLNICDCTLINGQFRNTIGESFAMDINYKVTVYIWVERFIKQA